MVRYLCVFLWGFLCDDNDFQDIFWSDIIQYNIRWFIFSTRKQRLNVFTKRNGVGWGDQLVGGILQRTGKSEIAAEFARSKSMKRMNMSDLWLKGLFQHFLVRRIWILGDERENLSLLKLWQMRRDWTTAYGVSCTLFSACEVFDHQSFRKLMYIFIWLYLTKESKWLRSICLHMVSFVMKK